MKNFIFCTKNPLQVNLYSEVNLHSNVAQHKRIWYTDRFNETKRY